MIKILAFTAMLAMGAVEITVIIAAVLLVVFTAVINIIRRKKGKNSCGCDCSTCGSRCPFNTDKEE